MNKADIAEKLANQAGLTKRASREAIDVVTSVVMIPWQEEKKSPCRKYARNLF